jgi:hypothetical protein
MQLIITLIQGDYSLKSRSLTRRANYIKWIREAVIRQETTEIFRVSVLTWIQNIIRKIFNPRTLSENLRNYLTEPNSSCGFLCFSGDTAGEHTDPAYLLSHCSWD